MGTVHWELLPKGRTLNSNLYCTQLQHVNREIQCAQQQGSFKERCVFHHDNAPLHRSNQTSFLIRNTFNWDILPQPPYSPDISPSDCWLFRSLKNFLRWRNLAEDGQLENAIDEFFDAKLSTNFFQRGIKKVLIINKNGN